MRGRRLMALQPSRAGFGLFWAMPLAMLLGLPSIGAPSSDWLLFVCVNQLALVAGIPLCARAFASVGARRPPTWLLFLVGALLSASGFLYTYCFTSGLSSTALSVVSGVVAGFSCSASYVLWNAVYAGEGQARSAVYLPASAVLAVMACLVLLVLPGPVVSLCLVVALPFASTYALWRSAQDMEPAGVRPMRGHGRSVAADLWKPVLCAAVVCFAQSLAGHMPALYDTGLVLAMLCGFGAASLVVAVVGLASTSDFGTHSVYRALFPLIGIVLFIPALFGDQWMPFMVGTLTFGARIMMLLTLILCAAYAARTQFSPMLVYLACAYPLHVAGFLGDSVGFLLVAQDLSDYAVALRIPIVCLVICFAALTIVSFGKRPRSLAEPVDDTLLINPPRSMGADRGAPVRRSRVGRPAVSDRSRDGMGAVDGGVGGAVRGRADAVGEASVPEAPADGPRLPAGLSAREQEVVELLLKGNTIAAISRKLYISENTTRGHMKRIYRKFDVHSRQELVDLLEGRG